MCLAVSHQYFRNNRSKIRMSVFELNVAETDLNPAARMLDKGIVGQSSRQWINWLAEESAAFAFK